LHNSLSLTLEEAQKGVADFLHSLHHTMLDSPIPGDGFLCCYRQQLITQSFYIVEIETWDFVADALQQQSDGPSLTLSIANTQIACVLEMPARPRNQAFILVNTPLWVNANLIRSTLIATGAQVDKVTPEIYAGFRSQAHLVELLPSSKP